MQPSLNQCAYFTHGGQHADETQRTTSDDLLTLHEDGELPVAPLNHFHFELKFAPQRCRHPGGVKAGASIPATSDGDSHGELLGRARHGAAHALSFVRSSAIRDFTSRFTRAAEGGWVSWNRIVPVDVSYPFSSTAWARRIAALIG